MNLEQFLRLNISQKQQPVGHARQLNPERWKEFVVEVLNQMQENSKNEEKKLINMLIKIVQSIQESYFIESALQILPFKPQFVENNYLQSQSIISTIEETTTSAAEYKFAKIHLKKTILTHEEVSERKLITEKTLKNQLNKPGHPYIYIINNFAHLLELKYKITIQKKKLNMNEMIKHLKKDLQVFQQFIKKSSKPFCKLFKLNINEAKQVSINKMNHFISTYLLENTTINNSLHKIVSFAVQHQYSDMINKKMPNFVDLDNYQIPTDFKIDGCYLQSMNSLIQFSQLRHEHQKAMKKLLQFRNNILKDINDYYISQTGSIKELKLNVEVQIQIIRFIVGKLKSWACQILTELKFLQVIYGDSQIAYKFDFISFMYTQLILAFEILQIN